MAQSQTSLTTQYSWNCRSCGNQGTTWTYRHRAQARAEQHARYCPNGGDTTIIDKDDLP